MSTHTKQISTKTIDHEACNISETLTSHLRTRAVAMQSETNLAGAIELAKQLGLKANYCQIKPKRRVLKNPKVSE